MKVSGKQRVFDRYVKWADAFAEKGLGAPHLKSILVDVNEDEGYVTFTAENGSSAIRFTVGEGLDVTEGGLFLLDAAGFRTAVSLAAPEETLEVSYEDSSRDHTVHFAWGRKGRMTLPLIPLGPKVAVPEIREAGTETVSLTSDDFRRGWLAGSVSYDRSGNHPALQGVHVGVRGGLLRFTSMGPGASTFYSVPTVSGESDFAALMNPNLTSSILEYVAQGERVDLTLSTDRKSVHAFVIGEEGERMFQIRLQLLAQPIEDFPVSKVGNTIAGLLGDSDVLTIDRSELLRLFYAADTVLTYNKASQAREVEIRIDGEKLSVTAGDGSSGSTATMSEETDVTTWTGEDLRYFFKWGLYGNHVRAYPGTESTMKVALLRRKGKTIAMALFLEGWDPASGEAPEDYISVVPVSINSAAS